ncbi:MAG: glutamate formimidoyltransferase [Ignavibacteria bacterium]|nr:MAG: glutamate formimidoyltransferase [Ignavibacteria bacterium]KAF0159685.1 MAG: glutamate formimidoyltransferase [Ignavibacteria bacterium]
MDLSKSLQQYFDDLSSNAPTPGGGNVAALCGALSSSLGAMVCGLTIGKKKYAEVEAEMIEVKTKLESFQKEFFELGQKDNAAFDKVMNAFRLPKETDAEKEVRSKAIEDATLGAAAVPEVVMKKAKEILPLLKTIIEKGNRNSLSDAGVAAALVATASKGAYLNVLINCSSLSNQTIAQEVKKRADIVLDETCAESNRLLDKVFTAIQPQ